MALDAALLALLAKELHGALQGERIDRITQPSRDEAVLAMHGPAGSHRLLLSVRSGAARVGLTQQTFENPETPPGFCMLLRKYLTGGRLLEVQAVPGERILFFDFQCVNEMGDPVRRRLAAELMGRYANLVLLHPDGRIVDALKRVAPQDSPQRPLLPGLPYELPARPDRPDFFAQDGAALVAAARRLPLAPAQALGRCVGGVGPVICREAVWRALGEDAPAADCLSDEQAAALAAAVDAIAAAHAAPIPTLVLSPQGAPVEFSFLPLTQYLPGCTLQRYDTFSQLLEACYAQRDREERLRRCSRELTHQVKALYERACRKQEARRGDLAQCGDADHLRLWGELLSANLWRIPAGAASVQLENYYTGGSETVPLDARLGPSANAQRYFKEYKKKQTAARVLQELVTQGAAEIEYLHSVLDEVGRAEGEQALEDIREELKGQGYLRHVQLRRRRGRPADFLRYRSADGFEILVGRNNLQNDRLTLHLARGRDLWFHVKDAPGSHTVVLSEGREVPAATRELAAGLAAWHSGCRFAGKTAVDCTEVRNVRRAPGGRPGMVLYEHYHTVYVTPQPPPQP